jgi:hypothetical protein
MFTAPLPRSRSLLLRGEDHIENSSTLLLTARVCWTVYRVVAWQRVDQICYSLYSLINTYLFSNFLSIQDDHIPQRSGLFAPGASSSRLLRERSHLTADVFRKTERALWGRNKNVIFRFVRHPFKLLSWGMSSSRMLPMAESFLGRRS